MKRKIFAVVCVLMLSASALTWAVGPDLLVVIEDGCSEIIDDGYSGVTICEDGVCRNIPEC